MILVPPRRQSTLPSVSVKMPLTVRHSYVKNTEMQKKSPSENQSHTVDAFEFLMTFYCISKQQVLFFTNIITPKKLIAISKYHPIFI